MDHRLNFLAQLLFFPELFGHVSQRTLQLAMQPATPPAVRHRPLRITNPFPCPAFSTALSMPNAQFFFWSSEGGGFAVGELQRAPLTHRHGPIR